MTPLSSVPQSTSESAPRLGSTVDYEKFLDCVHCGLCTAACPTYLETGDENNSPRGRIYLMRAVTDGRLELTDPVARHLDLCLDCRSCESACPSGVQYGRLIEPFRVEMKTVPRGDSAPRPNGWFQRWILYGLFPYPKRLRWSLVPARWTQWLGLDRFAERMGLLKWLPEPIQRMHRLLPRLRSREVELPHFLPATGPRRARVALFTGCVADAMFPHVNWATARVLQANGCDVVIPPSQACCGAIHYHSGAGQPALELARRNQQAFADESIDAVIVNVAGCGAMLKEYGHLVEDVAPENAELQDHLKHFAGKVRDASEFLAELGLVTPPTEVPLTVTYHDACHLCHAQKIREQPRQLLHQIPGLKLIPLPESEICCGAAGTYNLMEGEMSDRLADRKLNHILATGAEAVVSGNAGCTLQIQAALRAAGREIPVVHPMELLDQSYRSSPKMPR